MNILGVSALYHDAAAALLSDGCLVAAAQEERFSRRKHDAALPVNAIDFCLRSAGIKHTELDYVVFYEKPIRKFERILSTQISTFPRSVRQFPRAMLTWLSSKLWIRTTLAQRLKIPPGRILFTDHHQSHAASAFLCSPFEEAAVVVMDGVGEWATSSLWHGTSQGGLALKPIAELQFPDSIGLLYSAFTAYLGFEVNEGEYKVMGMAPYGVPRYVERVEKLLQRSEGGAFRLDMSYFSFHYHPEKSFNDKFVALFGLPRSPDQRFITRSMGHPGGEDAPSRSELDECQRFADIAASIQVVTEGLMLDAIQHAARMTGCRNLCMAGGVALNSVANGRIVREGPFEGVYIQPAAGDAGGALGAALYTWHVAFGHGQRIPLDRADLGESISEARVSAFVRDARARAEELPDDVALTDRVAQMLADGQVVGWCQGRFEWGPRALGHRSILADPRFADMKERVNRRIKFREPFRPFAPATLWESGQKFYDLERSGGEGDPTRFMLMTAQIRDDVRDGIQATTHADGSSRVQRVKRSHHPRFYDLISRFGDSTGFPVLLNTSFNLKGEPIVNTPLEAYSTFCRSGLDALILDRWIVRRP